MVIKTFWFKGTFTIWNFCIDFWFFFSYFIKIKNLKAIKTEDSNLKRCQLNLHCTKIKGGKKKKRFNQYILFSTHPPEIELTTLLHRNLGLHLHLRTALNSEGLVTVRTKEALWKPAKLCLLFPTNNAFLSFIKSPHFPFTRGLRTRAHRQNLLSFINELWKTSANNP